ncbi:signal peptidase I [Lachnobacterium bovis]|uniref:signal peptidase I n=1 Tax=Lachnobacterium bovis TaxID=140626 RepID=UPI0003B69816|nr:signal peptidase I [Lachnobacterium bovis]
MDKLKNDSNSKKENEENVTVMQEVWSWIKTIAIVIFIVVFINKFIIINATIPSGSMENTIMTDSRLIGFRLSYIFSKPNRGDIVIFKFPVDESELYIKRVIGLPGEKITIKKGNIYINDSKKPLKETYLKEKWTYKNDKITFKVPNDSYLMLGDNRNGSSDAREWAEIAFREGKARNEKEAKKFSYVHKDKIIGRAIVKYYKGFENLLNK